MTWITTISAIHHKEKVVRVEGQITVSDIHAAAEKFGLRNFVVMDCVDELVTPDEFPYSGHVWIEPPEKAPIPF
jgi:hypothetical protein